MVQCVYLSHVVTLGYVALRSTLIYMPMKASPHYFCCRRFVKLCGLLEWTIRKVYFGQATGLWSSLNLFPTLNSSK